MKIFISYRRKDSGRDVGRIRDKLKTEFGEQSVFRDLVDIPVGVDFRSYLNEKTNECKVMLVVIGPTWATITGADGNKRLFDPIDYTRIEIETGLKRLMDKDVTVIPVFVGGAQMPAPQEIPESIGDLTFQNGITINDDPYFDFDMERLIRDIRSFYPPVPDKEYFEPEIVYIAQGPFLMGCQTGEGIPDYETPQHEVSLPAFCIGIHPVTNYQYSLFIGETRTQVSAIMGWDGQRFPSGSENHPVTGVTWFEALAYCQWLNEKTGRKYSLPNEAQWEKACRGGNNYLYPWGNEFDPKRSNHGCSAVAAVEAYPAQNEFGCFDLVGNVLQWTRALWGQDRFSPDNLYRYPWKDDERNDLTANREIRRIVRGSTIKDDILSHRCSARRSEHPDQRGFRGARTGFRVILNVE